MKSDERAPLSGADYDQFAPFYDLEFAGYDDDLPLYRAFAALGGGPLLELGCGSGRVLVPLAADGHSVTGVDLSPAMLALAREAVTYAGVAERVTLVQDDIRSLSQIESARYGLAFSAINSFLHLETQEDQLATLAAVARCLQSEGLFIADLFPPHTALLSEYDGRLIHAGTYADAATGERIDKFSTSVADQAEQRIVTTFFYDRLRHEGTTVRVAASFTLRYIGHFEMQLLLERSGFTDVSVYGSYDLEPFTDASERMIVVARRP